jgi:phosphoglycerol transferase
LAARWRVGLLALVAALVWLAHYDRWTLESWSTPTDYRGDALEILARIQAAAEGDAVPLRPQMISRLGAPFGANWSAYPSSDLLLIWSLGRVARFTGVFAAANLAMLAGAITAALAFYGCARWLRVRWEWSFATALLFAFTFQTFHRGLPHLFLLFSWTIPPALLACGLVAASRRLRWPGPGAGFCVMTALVIGVGNPYTLFLFVQLLGWALVAQWLGARRKANLITGSVALVVAIAAFFVVESHVWLFAPDTAATSPLVRNYGGTERYALKPLELLLPPAGHRWDALAFFGHRYERWSEWRGGEAFAPYLGLVGIAGLVGLAVVTLRALLRRRRLPAMALPAGWVLAFASVGGVTNIVAFFTGLIVFRATNRFSIFISALVLLFLATRLARWSLGRPAWLSLAAATLVAIVGLADQLPRAPGLEQQQRIAARVESDRDLGRRLEGRLPRGAMVFQMPVMMFPEVTPPHQLGDYDYFRPYLATHSLRFSYGTLKGRSRGRWQRDAEELPTAEFVRRLERYGFAALYFNRRGFADRGEKLLADLRGLGRTRVFEGTLHEQVIVLLEPAARPEVPVARTLTFGRGWQNTRPGEARWAYGPAALSYHNPFPHALGTRVKFVVSGVGERTLVIRVAGGPTIERRIASQQREITLPVQFQPGVNRIDLETLEPAVRLSHERGQLHAFALHRATVELETRDAASVVAGVN